MFACRILVVVRNDNSDDDSSEHRGEPDGLKARHVLDATRKRIHMMTPHDALNIPAANRKVGRNDAKCGGGISTPARHSSVTIVGA